MVYDEIPVGMTKINQLYRFITAFTWIAVDWECH